MSTLEYNLVSAGGDGITRSAEKPSVKRTPVPSAQKLGIRPQTAKSENVKRKLEEALNRLSPASPSRKFCRKRAQTLAEITPSKRKAAGISNRLSAESAVGVSVKSPPKKEDASRRVYHQLLLNAWRRRRAQVATLSDSSRRLQTQVDQLQIQVDVLQKLRESESQRRSESANEAEHLRLENFNLHQSIEKLQQDGKHLETQIVNLQQRIEEVNASKTNVKNELLTTKSELSSCENKLQKAYRNEALLKQENQGLLDKIEEYKEAISEQTETIHSLHEDIESVEKNLDTANLNNSNLEETKTELEIKLEKEKDNKKDLEQQYMTARARKNKLAKKICKLDRNMNLLKDTKRKMLQDNFALKKSLEEMEMCLKEEQDKTWWKTTAKFMLNSLHNAAYMMLPVYTDVVDNFTPTEDEIEAL